MEKTWLSHYCFFSFDSIYKMIFPVLYNIAKCIGKANRDLMVFSIIVL